MFENLSSMLTRPGLMGMMDNKETELSLKEGENRFVSVLFADIKGFTAMSELLEPDVLQHLIDQLMISFSERINKYGGYVDKYEGDRIMAHFGSLQYLENNARRAVYAGLELIDVIQMYNLLRKDIPELCHIPTDLAVRVGVNCGMVATGKVGLKREGDFTVYGDVVNLASRMEEMGMPMRIMLPGEMKDALEGYFEFEEHGTMQVKGKSLPISTWLVKGVNLRQFSRLISQSSFIGREAELTKLSEVYKANLAMQEAGDFQTKAQVLRISAVAGMGKTRLIKEFSSSLPGGCCLIAEISPIYQAPFASFRELIRSHYNLDDSISPELARQRMDRGLREMQSILPDILYQDLLAAFPQLFFIAGYNPSHGLESGNMEDVVSSLNNSILLFVQALALKCAAEGKLLVLVFDDLHFCDEVSLNALVYLLKNVWLVAEGEALNARIMFILSCRQGQQPLLKLPSGIKKEELLLAELNESQIESFIRGSIKDFEMPGHILKELGRKSAGNPFYIEEWIASLKRKLSSGESIDLYDFAIPENVLELVLSRLMHLDKQSIILLQKASAIGLNFYKSVLQKLDDKLAPKSDIELNMQHISAVEFLYTLSENEEDTEYGFRHSITHQAVYDSILKINKKLMHKIIAEIIEAQYQQALPQWFFALEHHYAEAEEQGKRLYYLRESIDFARSVFMNKKTIEYCDKLLALENLAKREEIVTLKATVLLDMGLYAEATELLAQLGKVYHSDEYVLAQTRILMATGNMQDADKYLRTRLDGFSSASLKNMAKILHLDIRRQLREDKNFEKNAGELLCEVADNPYLCARLENTVGLYYQNRAEYHKAIEYYNRAIEHGINHKSLAAKAHHNKGNVLCKLGKPDEAMLHYQTAYQLARFLDDEGGKARIGSDMGTLFMAKGDYALAASKLKESSEMAVAAGNLNLASEINYNLAYILLTEGKLSQALTAAKKCIKQFTKMHNLKNLSYAKDMLGDILYKQGKFAEAEAVYLDNLAFQEQIEDREGIAHTYGNLGNTAAEKQDWQAAEEYYGLQARVLSEIGDVEGEGKAWYNLAMLDEERGELESAIPKVEKALLLFRRGGFEMYLEDVQDYLQELKDKHESTINK